MFPLRYASAIGLLAVALPALVGAAEKSKDTIQACSLDAPEALAHPEYQWRMRADRQLECVIGMLDEALKTRDGDVVTLSRRDAERLRALAFWAKDAAARIGR